MKTHSVLQALTLLKSRPLKWKYRHFDEIFVIEWRFKSRQNDENSVSMSAMLISHLRASLMSRWRHSRATFSVLTALCEENHRGPVHFPYKWWAMRRVNTFFALWLGKPLLKYSIYRCFETPWRLCDVSLTWICNQMPYFSVSCSFPLMS